MTKKKDPPVESGEKEEIVEKKVEQNKAPAEPEFNKGQPTSVVSKVLPDKTMIEMVIDEQGNSGYAVLKEGQDIPIYQRQYGSYVPLSSNNSLIETESLVFPSKAEGYGSEKQLFEDIISYLKSYVELPDHFYNIVAIYTMMTWVYEQFSEVAYLRVLGAAGTGKTRFIKTIGNICYKPVIASGSATASSLFRIVDLVRGTFVFDEADFQNSELWSEMIKILNSGHTEGCPVFRTEKNSKTGEFFPRAFYVFGPKVIASRNRFADEALESRCLTEEFFPKKQVSVPIHLPPEFKTDALAIRNKLLMFRFKNYGKIAHYKETLLSKADLDPRMQQTSLSVLATAQTIGDKKLTDGIIKFLTDYNDQLRDDRGNSEEVDVLMALARLMLHKKCNGPGDVHGIVKSKGIKIKLITKVFNETFKEEYGMVRSMNGDFIRNNLGEKKIGDIIRNKLRLKTRRQKGGYHVPLSEEDKIRRTIQRYGITMDNLEEVECGFPEHSNSPKVIEDDEVEDDFVDGSKIEF